MSARDDGGVSDVVSKEIRTGEMGLGGKPFPPLHMQTKENCSVISRTTWKRQVKRGTFWFLCAKYCIKHSLPYFKQAGEGGNNRPSRQHSAKP